MSAAGREHINVYHLYVNILCRMCVEPNRDSEFKWLTVFLVSFLVQEYIGLHVPDELVSQKLRFLSGP